MGSEFNKTEYEAEVERADEALNKLFSDDEREKFSRLSMLDARLSILRKYQETFEELGNLTDTFNDKTTSVAMSLLVLKDWIKEIDDERNTLFDEIATIVATATIADMYNNMSTTIKNKMHIDDVASDHITKAFLNKKFGDGDSAGKDAMKDICTEAVQFFIQTIIDGTMKEDFGVK